MGWTGTHRETGQPLRDYFDHQFGVLEFLDFAVVKLNTAYAACRRKDKPDGPVFGVVIQMHHYRDEYENFCYKETTETQGPCEDECPERVLKLLSPLDQVATPGTDSHEWAGKWRAACQARIDRRKARPKVKHNDRIRFPQPFTFSDGEEIQEFIVRIIDRKTNLYRPASHGYDYSTCYRIPNWRDMAYTIVK